MSKDEIKHERHVLIVDDEPDYLATLGDAFRAMSQGRWQIRTATGTEAALEILKTKKIELVVWDVNAPAPDGARFLELLESEHPQLKKVVMASTTTDEKDTATFAVGADLFLGKPVSPEGMKSVFNRLCGLLGWTAPESAQGVLHGVSLADLVQMECLAHNSSILEIYREQSLGRVYIENGQIIHAVCGENLGEGALYKLLALTGCAFELNEFNLPPDRTINRTWEYLLAEGNRRRHLLDLHAKTGAAAPPGAETVSSKPASQASEMLICSGVGEVLYNWKCSDPAARVALMKTIASRAEQLIPEIQLGKLDRLEIQLADGRAILQPRADRMIFVLMAANPENNEG